MNDAILLQSIVVAIVAGTPIVLAGTGELLTQRSGIMNLGVEGMMLVGGVVGFFATTETGSPVAGLAAGILAGAMFSLVHAFLSVTMQANQIVTGIGMVILGTGLSSFIGELGTNPIVSRPGGGSFNQVFGEGLAGLPVVGPLLFGFDPVVYASWAFVALAHIFIFHTRSGMELRALGNNPGAVDSAGLNVTALRFRYVAIGGGAAGAGGAYMTLALFNTWNTGITAGAGWIAVALVIFAVWRPARMLVAAYTLGAISSLGFTIQLLGWGVPHQVLSMLPFIATLVVLIVASAVASKGSMDGPAGLAVPYSRERR